LGVGRKSLEAFFSLKTSENILTCVFGFFHHQRIWITRLEDEYEWFVTFHMCPWPLVGRVRRLCV
jgi:hypothetical protein